MYLLIDLYFWQSRSQPSHVDLEATGAERQVLIGAGVEEGGCQGQY